MNARQLLLGLSILIPAGAYGAAWSPFNYHREDVVEAPSEICEFTMSKRKGLCYQLEYRSTKFFVFVWADTLEGRFFGFALPKDNSSISNQLPAAYQNLEKNLVKHYPRNLGVGPMENWTKLPRRINK